MLFLVLRDKKQLLNVMEWQNNKGKGRLKYLLQQTEIFAHFAKGEHSSSQKKTKGRYELSFKEPLKYLFASW